MRRISACLLALGLIVASGSARGQGVVLPGAGPINRSMGGASTALPVDFGGSYWNPAILSGLEDSEVLIGSELIIPSTHLTTGLRARSINGLFPPSNRYGVARSDGGVVPSLATGASFKLDDASPTTFGLGIFGFLGGSVNYAGNFNQPVLAPRRAPNFFGVGPIVGNASVLTINPMASRRLSEKFSVGGGPIIATTAASSGPAFFAPGPKDANGLPTFPTATNARTYWGAGFQLGLLYEVNEAWNLGFSYKSEIWQERWSYNASNPDLSPRRIGLDVEYPAIYSWGVAYKAIPKALIDVDFRFFDYSNTKLFGQKVVDGGLGWRSIFAVAVGGQYELTERATFRAGYIFNQNPIPEPATLFNAQFPAVIQHTLSLGLSYDLTEDITFTGGWVHGFRGFSEGSILELPGSTAKLDAQNDSILAGVNIKFGGGRKKPRAEVADAQP